MPLETATFQPHHQHTANGGADRFAGRPPDGHPGLMVNPALQNSETDHTNRQIPDQFAVAQDVGADHNHCQADEPVNQR